MALIAGTYRQIDKKKMQLLCRGRLNHLGSTYFIYRQNTNNDAEGLKKWQDVLKQYSPDSDFGVCPGESSGVFNYQLNLAGQFADKDNRAILFFDSEPNEVSYCKDFDKQSVSWRHFQGANFLLSDGSVVYYKNGNTP